MKNKSFLMLSITSCFIYGYFNIYGTIANEYFNKYGLTESESSSIMGIVTLTSILGCFVVSFIIDKYKIYKKVFLILNSLGIVFHITMIVLLELFDQYSYIILIINFPIISMCTVSIFNCSLDLVIELTYPVGESISGGCIVTTSQISGIIGVWIFYFNILDSSL